MKKVIALFMLFCIIGAAMLNIALPLMWTVLLQQWSRAPVNPPRAALTAIETEFGFNILAFSRAAWTETFGYQELNLHTTALNFEADELLGQRAADRVYLSLIEVQTGWPAKSLVRRHVEYHNEGTWYETFLTWSGRAKSDAGRFVLPFQPIWKGFLINTLLSTAIISAIFLPGAVKRLLRLRRIQHGLCPLCAYPVGVSDRCSECGEPIPQGAPRHVPTSAS